MKKGKKLNKLKVSIVIIILVLMMTITVFGRYIYNSLRDAYLVSEQFYFSSDILTTNGAHYQYANWGGSGTYEIGFEVYSYINTLSRLDYDLDYTITCSTTSNKVKVRNKFCRR